MIKNDLSRIQRRDFLRVGVLSSLGVGLPSLLANEVMRDQSVAAPAKNVILIWLNGGPSTIDMWDLKPHAPATIRGQFQPIDTSADNIQICEHLPNTAKQMHSCVLVRSAQHTIAEHQQGTEFVIPGNPISPSLKYPAMGAVVSKQKHQPGQGVPSYIDLSGFEIGNAGYLGASHDPFVVDGISPQPRMRQSKASDQFALSGGMSIEDLQRKNVLLQQLEQGFTQFEVDRNVAAMSEFQQQAVDILCNGKTREALDVNRESEKTLARYGFGLGRSALAARRLIESGARFVTIGTGGWDTHANNFGQLRTTLLPQLDQALAALIQDLKDRGLLDETIVYCVGEFNRTPSINGQGGRDHWARSMSVLLAGGGLKRGYAYGSTDRTGSEPEENPCSPADINATILNQLGIAPDSTLMTRSGRPTQVMRGARVLQDLIG